MLVSILINNYNYAKFLRDAIDSALSQSYPHVEVIVVDDGSSDDSPAIINSYGNRIKALFKENGGQPSAINAGFAASQGDIICLLDADDVFLSQKVALVVQAWQQHPQSCVVYHQMQNVDAQNVPIGSPWPKAVWCCDIRDRVKRSGGWWPRPNTSALSFSRPFLERMFPVPTGPRLVWTDTYLTNAAPFFGSVAGIRAPLTLYRVHGQNNWAQSNLRVAGGHSIDTLRRRMDQYVFEFELLQDTLRNKLCVEVELSIADHPEYQRYRMAVGEPVSLLQVVMQTLRCPASPWPLKLRDSAKVILNRW